MLEYAKLNKFNRVKFIEIVSVVLSFDYQIDRNFKSIFCVEKFLQAMITSQYRGMESDYTCMVKLKVSVFETDSLADT